MSARKRSKRSTTGRSSWLTAACLLALAAYAALSLAGPADALDNPGGPVGAAVVRGLTTAFGAFWAWAVPLLLAGVGVGLLAGRLRWLKPLSWRLAVLWLVTVSWVGLPDGPYEWATAYRWAGWTGTAIGRGVSDLVGVGGGRIFLGLALLVAVILILWPVLGPPLAAAGRVLQAMARPFVALGRPPGPDARRPASGLPRVRVPEAKRAAAERRG